MRSTDERGAQADVARRTGWSREQIRQIMRAAEAEQSAAEWSRRTTKRPAGVVGGFALLRVAVSGCVRAAPG
ncbi:hypothetical protein OG930_13875 [Streptomyces sp. NBC_01799]|nr:hypothetical protein OG930_13875 [Streptomyces sp. NBC_01799]